MSLPTLTINYEPVGEVRVKPRINKIITDATYNQLIAAGFLNNYVESGDIDVTDWFKINYKETDGSAESTFRVSFDSDQMMSLYPIGDNVIKPITAGDFVVFGDTAGSLADYDYLPSNPDLSKVAMKGSNISINKIASFSDISGTVSNTASAIVNGGNIQAGSNGVPGSLISFPATSNKGNLSLSATSNSGNFPINITNTALGQATNYSITDPVSATGSFLLSPFSSPDPNEPLTIATLLVSTDALNSGNVIIYPGGTGKSYRILDIHFGIGTNFSGGDRNVRITDGTTTWTTILLSDLGAQTNMIWGKSSGLPTINTNYAQFPTATGAPLYATYQGGTINFLSGGSFIIRLFLLRFT